MIMIYGYLDIHFLVNLVIESLCIQLMIWKQQCFQKVKTFHLRFVDCGKSEFIF